MKIWRRGLSVVLILTMVVTGTLSGAVLSVKAATDDILVGEWTGTSEELREGMGIDRYDTFTENWELGLNQDKWEVAKAKTSYVSDFQIVDDPIEGSDQGKVMQITRTGCWLVPTDAYYPNGSGWGELKTIEFKFYLKDMHSTIEGKSYGNGGYVPSFSFRASLTENNGTLLASGADGLCAYNRKVSSAGVETGGAFASNSQSFEDNMSTWGYWPSRPLDAAFDLNGWVSVKIEIRRDGTATVLLTDADGTLATSSEGRFNQSGAKLALGYIASWANCPNIDTSKDDWGGQLFIDDIKATFQPSDFDKNVATENVEVYYEGNTYLTPGETISLTGEQLGHTVASVKYIRMTDGEVSLAGAAYIPESHYDAFYDVDPYAYWDKAKGEATPTELKIEHTSDYALHMILPDTEKEGIFALLLEAASDSGEDELVVINNPRVTVLMGDDGDYVSDDGWLKLGGENLSVQDSCDSVSVLIMDSDGNKLHLLQNQEGKEDCIHVDTTDNYGVDNNHYMQVFLDGLDLDAGDYQIMVHNGYGGDYGWSMPFDFQVGCGPRDEQGNPTGEWDTRAANQVWRDKGVFNVQDYGAVGDSNTNDTAAIQRAINAAVENGGGMVYFPCRPDGSTAHYRITAGLIAKENVSFVGDGYNKTILYYSGFLATTIDQTEFFISFERNFEIADMELYCGINYFKTAIKQEGKDAGKFYMHGVKANFHADSWRNNSYTLKTPDYNGMSASEWYEDMWSSVTRKYLISQSDLNEFKYTFIRYENNTFMTGDYSAYMRLPYTFYSEYADVTGWNELGSYCGGGTAGFLTDCSIYAMHSNTVYRGLDVEVAVGNNRETFIIDSGGCTDVKMRYVDPDGFRNDLEVAFSSATEKQLAEVEKLAKEYEGRLYYIASGFRGRDGAVSVIGGETGVGQIRYIERKVQVGSLNFYIVNSPFAVQPNRNNTVKGFETAQKAHHTYVVGAEFTDGSNVGPNGSSYDYVFSNCKTDKVPSVSAQISYSGWQWYYTFDEMVIKNTSSVHNHKKEESVNVFHEVGGAADGICTIGARMSNSLIEAPDVMVYIPNAGKMVEYGNVSTTLENCTIICPTPSLRVEDGRGVFIRNVRQYTDASNKTYSEINPYQDIKQAQKYLSAGYLWADNLAPSWIQQKGDINNDNIVSMADLLQLKEYLAEKGEFSSEQIKVANMNQDIDEKQADIIDARDFLYLRVYILFKDDEEELKKAIMEIGITGENPMGDYARDEDDLRVDFTGISEQD